MLDVIGLENLLCCGANFIPDGPLKKIIYLLQSPCEKTAGQISEKYKMELNLLLTTVQLYSKSH